MYAVIKTGGKQYKVTEGDVLRVEKLNAEVNATVELTEVLLVAGGDNIKRWKTISRRSKSSCRSFISR